MPIVNRTSDGFEVPETGAGGGCGDLYHVHELELPEQSDLEKLDKLCVEHIHDPEALSRTRAAIYRAFTSKTRSLALDEYGFKDDTDISLKNLVDLLGQASFKGAKAAGSDDTPCSVSTLASPPNPSRIVSYNLKTGHIVFF